MRDLSSRAQITATSFVNDYSWGDFPGDPQELVKSCFDLHLYIAKWGSRRLIIRLPKHVMDPADLVAFISELDWVTVSTSDDHLMIDIDRNDVDCGCAWINGSGWLDTLAPLRTDLLSGDLRLFYLLCLTSIGPDFPPDAVKEPLPGIGPLTGALEAAMDFLDIDRDLVVAAAATPHAESDPDAIHAFVSGIAESEKTDLLIRLMEGDAHIGSDLQRRLRLQTGDPSERRTVAELRMIAEDIAGKRKEARGKR